MINFNFTVDDIDAENIMSCMHDKELNCLTEISDLMMKIHESNDLKEQTKFQNYINWWEKHKEYLKELRLKMTNTNVGKDPQ